jgi:uncharacterized protein YjdB
MNKIHKKILLLVSSLIYIFILSSCDNDNNKSAGDNELPINEAPIIDPGYPKQMIVSFKTAHNTYLIDDGHNEQNGVINANSTELKNWGKFIIEGPVPIKDGDRVNIRSIRRNYFFSAEPDGTIKSKFLKKGGLTEENETFTLIIHTNPEAELQPDDLISLKSKHNKYLSANKNSSKCIANVTQIKESEKFTLIVHNLPDQVLLKDSIKLQIEELYKNILLRTPDPIEVDSVYNHTLVSVSQLRNTSRNLFHSVEFLNGLTDEQKITSLFKLILKEKPDLSIIYLYAHQLKDQLTYYEIAELILKTAKTKVENDELSQEHMDYVTKTLNIPWILNTETHNPVSVTGNSIDKSLINIAQNSKVQLNATIEPSNATNKNITWSTDNKAIATVSQNGLVTAVSPGSAIIKATTEDGNFTDSCTAFVKTTGLAVSGVSINKSSIFINKGSQMKLSATISPPNATDNNLEWSSSKNSIASVSADGLVSGNSFGQATITVKTEDGNYTDTCTVKVEHLPIVDTTEIAGNLDFTVKISGTAAEGGGHVKNQGASRVKERGLCWNTTGNPTINNSHKADGSGSGIFSNVSIIGLVENTTYYVRAYATNNQRTVYGNQVTFNSGYAYGTEAEGGYVFYNDGKGGGLTVGKENLYEENFLKPNMISFKWMDCGYFFYLKKNTCTLNGNTETDIGTGLANSMAIIEQSNSTDTKIAAQSCLEYNDGKYYDWFLPSKDELDLIYKNLFHNKNAIDHWHSSLYGGNYMANASYWSSSEHDDETVWTINFHINPSASTSYQVKSAKGSKNYTRPVRSF